MGALSAPSSPQQIRILNAVIATVSVISAVGAGWIILSFVMFKALRSFRHQLILGLAISDFLMALNFLSSAATNLGGPNIGSKEVKAFCDFNGYMIETFVVQTDYWILTIAICTYLILANHKYQSSWIREHRVILWVIPWCLSILWASVGLAVIGVGDIGAWCWYTSDRIRLLVNFIPRWLIIITILGLYLRLYFLIHRVHNRFVSFDDETAESHRMGASATRSAPRVSYLGPENDCEREGGLTTRFTSERAPILKRISYQMMVYPSVYMLIWAIPTAVRIYQATTGKSAPFIIGTIDKACIVIQGFADAIVYGCNEQTWNLWRGIFSRSGSRM